MTMKIINFAKDPYLSNYLRGVEVQHFNYMNEPPTDDIPGMFSEGWPDFGFVDRFQVEENASITPFLSFYYNIEYLPNRSDSICWYTQDPSWRAQSIDLHREVLELIQEMNSELKCYFYGEVPTFGEEARMYRIKDYARVEQMYQMDLDWLNDMRPLVPLVAGFMPCMYQEHLFADDTITISDKQFQWALHLELCYAGMTFLHPTGKNIYMICTHDSATGEPLPDWVLPFQLEEMAKYPDMTVGIWTSDAWPFTDYQKGVVAAYV